jgi:hypothetical protein
MFSLCLSLQLLLSSAKGSSENLLSVKSKKIGHGLLVPGSSTVENNQMVCHTASDTQVLLLPAALLTAEAPGKLQTVHCSPGPEAADEFVLARVASMSMA